MTSTRIRILFWRVSPPEMLCLKTGMYTPGEVLRSPVEMVALRKPLFSIGKSPGSFCHWVSVHQIIRSPEYHPQRKIIWKHRYFTFMCTGSILGIASHSYVGYLCRMLCECVNVCVWQSGIHFQSLSYVCVTGSRSRRRREVHVPWDHFDVCTFGQVKACRKRLIQFLQSCFCVFLVVPYYLCVCVMFCFFFVCVFGGEMCTKIKCWCFNFVWSVFFPCKIVFLRKEYVYCMVRMYIWYVCLQTNLWVGKPVSHVEIGWNRPKATS